MPQKILTSKSKKTRQKRRELLRKPFEGMKNPNKSAISLENYLDLIYNTYDLRTTCKHQNICCKTACPQMNFCEFVNIITKIWGKSSNNEKIELICNSIEYFFRFDYEKWQMKSLIKPCMLLNSETGLCKWYDCRPLNCRLYGLWPSDDYEARVDKFAKVYEKYGLKREDLPLYEQCPNVKLVNDAVILTRDGINGLFTKLDEIDKKIGDFSSLQISQRENYRTFHDWLLFKTLGEAWLSKLTAFAMAADRTTMEAQITAIKEVFRKEFAERGVPDVVSIISKQHGNVDTKAGK